MKKQDQIIKVLKKLGYDPEIDEDGDVMFCYQMKILYFIIGDEDDNFVAVVHPRFYEIDEGEEALVMATCNKLNRELRMIKVSIDSSLQSVKASCEFFYTSAASLEDNIRHALSLQGIIRTFFRKEKMNLES